MFKIKIAAMVAASAMTVLSFAQTNQTMNDHTNQGTSTSQNMGTSNGMNMDEHWRMNADVSGWSAMDQADWWAYQTLNSDYYYQWIMLKRNTSVNEQRVLQQAIANAGRVNGVGIITPRMQAYNDAMSNIASYRSTMWNGTAWANSTTTTTTSTSTNGTTTTTTTATTTTPATGTDMSGGITSYGQTLGDMDAMALLEKGLDESDRGVLRGLWGHLTAAERSTLLKIVKGTSDVNVRRAEWTLVGY